MSFLNAEWRKLALANYAVDPEVLRPYLPFGTELDLWQDTCYLSLVGFMFVNTRLMGIKVPGHVNFEEVNLRFYVRRKEGDGWKRGVVFIKEIVPKPALSFVANTVYHENYETMPMRHTWVEQGERLEVSYGWQKGAWHTFKILAGAKPVEIPADSETAFITEHYWGYARINDHKTNEYEVTHPRWLAYPVESWQIEVDFGVVYGEDFAFLNALAPHSVMLAEGSEITVEPKKKIK